MDGWPRFTSIKSAFANRAAKIVVQPVRLLSLPIHLKERA